MNPGLLSIHKLLPLLPLLTSFCLVYVIQTHRLDSRARTSVLIYLGGMTCWAMGSLLLRHSDSIPDATICARFLRAGIILMTAAGLHFTYELLELRRRRAPYFAYTISLSLVALTLTTGLIIAPVGENKWGYFGGTGPLKAASTVFSISLALYAIALLLKYRYSKDAILYREANVTLLAFTIALVGAITDYLPTIGIPLYPSGMITNTVFVALIAYGAFKHQLLGVLSSPQPRIILSALTYSLIVLGMALAFTDSSSNIVFFVLFGCLFLAFHFYHFFDDLEYLMHKYLRIRKRTSLLNRGDDSSILFDNMQVGIVALNRQGEILFLNVKAARILGPEVTKNKSLSYLGNDIMRHKLEKYSATSPGVRTSTSRTSATLHRDLCLPSTRVQYLFSPNPVDRPDPSPIGPPIYSRCHRRLRLLARISSLRDPISEWSNGGRYDNPPRYFPCLL